MISQQESDSLNLIRWLSTLAIISCHILQGLGSDWAWVLNLGVQVFFFLSGFLYGNKRIVRARDFYLRRLLKLYVPYALWVAVAAALIGVLAPEAVTFTTVRRQLMMLGNLPGLNHLWFMYVIFLCYLILPAIDRAISARPALALTAMALCTAAVLWLRYSPIYLWVALYYVGYLCGRFPRVQPFVLAISATVTAGILAAYGLSTDTFRRPELVSNIIHASAGTALFLALHMTCRNVKFSNRFSRLLTNGGGTRPTSPTTSSFSDRPRCCSSRPIQALTY